MFLKLPQIIIIGFGENNVLCTKYIDIYEFRGRQGDVHGPPYIFCLLLKKRKKYMSMTCTKIKFYISFFFFFFIAWIIKKLQKGGPKNLRKGGPGVDVTDLRWAGWCPVIPPHCVDNLFAFEEGWDSVQEIFIYLFFNPSFRNIFHFILQK